jgi:bifunctional non-homologous end joining protein LigD
MEVKSFLDELGLVAWPKTSGSRGIHINIRIEPRWSFTEVRRAALALARAVERRCSLASSKWWKEERHGVFLDYNQNAKDRTTCSAFSVRPLPDARVSTPLRWDEVVRCDPADFTVLTIPDRFAKIGDPHAAMDQHAGVLDALLTMAERDEADGLGDAPWPPHFRKMEGEPARVQPSKARSSGKTKKVVKGEGEEVDPAAGPVAKKQSSRSVRKPTQTQLQEFDPCELFADLP